MKPLILAVLLLTPFAVIGQTSKVASKPPSELSKLREEFVRVTEEYKASIAKLLPFYESDIKRSEDKLEVSRKLYSEGLIPISTVEENERSVRRSQEKLAETRRQMANADKQIAAVLSDTEVDTEYQKAIQQRRRARKPRCSDWTLTAYQRTTANSVSFGYKIVCRN